MSVQPHRDFASLLDELIAAAEVETDGSVRPTIPFDYLSVVDELHSGRIKVSGEAVAAEYRDMASSKDGFSPEDLDALFGAVETPPDDLPVEPDAISRELKLDKASVAAEFARIRRAFAFRNHPDRVPPHMRERAIRRMQIANMLIDEAKRRAVKGR